MDMGEGEGCGSAHLKKLLSCSRVFTVRDCFQVATTSRVMHLPCHGAALQQGPGVL